MKANLKNIHKSNNIAKHRKEKGFNNQISIIDPKDGSQIVIARFYWTDSRAYCCLWVHGDSVYGSGAGYAGGYGYHKESAALDSAISDAGIELSENISGVGDGAMRDALVAIAKAATGKRKVFTVRAHA